MILLITKQYIKSKFIIHTFYTDIQTGKRKIKVLYAYNK
jgi:hypothetical protein